MSIYLIVQGSCPDKESYQLNPANYPLSMVRFSKFQTEFELEKSLLQK